MAAIAEECEPSQTRALENFHVEMLKLAVAHSFAFAMPPKKAASTARPAFDYTVVLDVVAVLCILVIAGRPDGLAITLCAIVVALAAVAYRCVGGVKAYWAVRAQQARAEELDRTFRPPARTPPAIPPPGRSGAGKSWLRDAD